MRTTEGRYDQRERRGQAVAEVRDLLARLYRGFVWWGSLYEDADLGHEQERRREEVVGLLGEFNGYYLARSVWLEQGTRRKINRFHRQVGRPLLKFRCRHSRPGLRANQGCHGEPREQGARAPQEGSRSEPGERTGGEPPTPVAKAFAIIKDLSVDYINF